MEDPFKNIIREAFENHFKKPKEFPEAIGKLKDNAHKEGPPPNKSFDNIWKNINSENYNYESEISNELIKESFENHFLNKAPNSSWNTIKRGIVIERVWQKIEKIEQEKVIAQKQKSFGKRLISYLSILILLHACLPTRFGFINDSENEKFDFAVSYKKEERANFIPPFLNEFSLSRVHKNDVQLGTKTIGSFVPALVETKIFNSDSNNQNELAENIGKVVNKKRAQNKNSKKGDIFKQSDNIFNSQGFSETPTDKSIIETYVLELPVDSVSELTQTNFVTSEIIEIHLKDIQLIESVKIADSSLTLDFVEKQQNKVMRRKTFSFGIISAVGISGILNDESRLALNPTSLIKTITTGSYNYGVYFNKYISDNGQIVFQFDLSNIVNQKINFYSPDGYYLQKTEKLDYSKFSVLYHHNIFRNRGFKLFCGIGFYGARLNRYSVNSVNHEIHGYRKLDFGFRIALGTSFTFGRLAVDFGLNSDLGINNIYSGNAIFTDVKIRNTNIYSLRSFIGLRYLFIK
jgi:hypothetical protein